MYKTKLTVFAGLATLVLMGCASDPAVEAEPMAEAPVIESLPEPAPEPAPVVVTPPPPVAAPPGPWAVSAISVRKPHTAEAVAIRLSQLGYGEIELRQVTLDDGDWLRVVIPGQASRADSEKIAQELASQHDLVGAWVLPPS